MARNSSTTETAADKAPRVRKTPAEKAQAALVTAQKRYDKAVAKRDRILGDIDAANNEVRQAQRFLDFAQGDPELPVAAPEADNGLVQETELQTV